MNNPQQKAFRQRVFVWSGDMVSGGSQNNFRVSLKSPIQRVIGAEIVSSSVAGYLLCIEEFPSKSSTTNAMSYWRFTDAITNGHYSDFKDEPWNPFTLNTLSIRWLNPDGTAATISNNHTIEIELLCAA